MDAGPPAPPFTAREGTTWHHTIESPRVWRVQLHGQRLATCRHIVGAGFARCGQPAVAANNRGARNRSMWVPYCATHTAERGRWVVGNAVYAWALVPTRPGRT